MSDLGEKGCTPISLFFYTLVLSRLVYDREQATKSNHMIIVS